MFFSLNTVRVPDPETPRTITSISCSSTPCPVPNRNMLVFRLLLASRFQITAVCSPAVAAASLRFTEVFGLAEAPSPTSRRHVQEADGVAEGLDRVAYSSVAGDQGPGLGLNVLIGSREPDTALV